MTKSYAALLQEIKVLQAHAEAVRAKELGGVIARIKEAIKAYSITTAELAPAPPAGSKRRTTRAGRAQGITVKYRDSQGRTWGGRGPRPRWLREAIAAGASLKDFEV